MIEGRAMPMQMIKENMDKQLTTASKRLSILSDPW